MKTKHVESLEEMVFRNKNKLYGAYSLRRKYNKYLTLSLILAFFLMLSGLAYPVIASFMIRHTVINIGDKTTTGEILPRPATEPPVVPPPPLPQPADPVKSARFVPPTVVIDSIDTDFGKQVVLADIKPVSLPGIEPFATPDKSKSEPTIETREKPEPVTAVQEMPRFPGGDEELFAFLHKNLIYPQEAKVLEMAGVVYVAFVVELDGSITDVKIERGIGSYCDDEAIRLVKSMPAWTPGKQNNIPVRVRYVLRVKFTLL
jgi:periplasmic protein TonB